MCVHVRWGDKQVSGINSIQDKQVPQASAVFSSQEKNILRVKPKLQEKEVMGPMAGVGPTTCGTASGLGLF